MSHAARLHALHAVVAHGSITQAAVHLGVSQPAVTMMIRALEDQYGVELLLRTGRRVSPTPLGRTLAELGRKMRDLDDEAEHALRAERGLEAVTLRLGADTPAHAMRLLAPLFAKVSSLRAVVSAGNSRDLREGVLEGRLDAAVLADQAADPRLRTVRLSRSPLVAFVARHHALSKRSALSLPELAGLPLITRERGSRTRHMLENALAAQGLEMSSVLECEGREAVHEAVAWGLGVGVVSQSELPDDSRVTAVTIEGKPMMTEEVLICLEDRARLRLLRMVLSVARTPLESSRKATNRQ